MTAYEDLGKLILDLFQRRSRNLNSVVSRIVSARSEEISEFLERELASRVREAFLYNGEDVPGFQDDPVREMEAARLKEDVCRHVHNFFRRYCPDGVSGQERASNMGNVFIPCDEQEVKLHWAGSDQYYVKGLRNGSDSFIHKDLAGFLIRDLDEYIRKELITLDDLTAARVERTAARIRAVRVISQKIICLLAEAEEFQKRLWLKKKFIVETGYCMTLDLIPDDLYPEIAANDDQRREWVRLHAIDEIKEHPEYSVPLTVEFLKANPFLMVDTRFFCEDFRCNLTSRMMNLSDSCNGLVICGEASQALSIMEKMYRSKIDCVVIDPPYNTGSNGFAYKDRYRRSSWLTMMASCISACTRLLKPNGIFAATIDDNEVHHLGLLLNETFGEKNRAACAPWRSEPSGGKEKTGLRTGHEYVLLYHNGDSSAISQDERSTGELNLHDRFGPYRKGRELRKWGGISSRKDRPNQWYPLIAPDGERVYPVKNDGTEGHWRWGKSNESIKAALKDPEVLHWEKCAFDKGVTCQGKPDRWVPFEKIRTTRKSVGWSTWLDTYGANADGTRELKDLFGKKTFDTPKPTQLFKWIVSLHTNHEGYVLDFFAGSGTTAHAVIDANREEGTNRKYILVEMEDHFDAVIKPRIQKTIYSREWKVGRPASRASGISHMFKYIRLESYEDCLNNLQCKPARADQKERKSMVGRDARRIRYMIDGQANGTDSILNVRTFASPESYTLRLKKHGNGDSRETRVDLPETFSYLVGLSVSTVSAPRRFNALFRRDCRGRLAVKGSIREDANGPWQFRSIIGTIPDGGRTLIIWRTLTGREEEDNLVLDEWFVSQGYSSDDNDFGSIYVNGRNNLSNLKPGNDARKVHLIDKVFPGLLWDFGA